MTSSSSQNIQFEDINKYIVFNGDNPDMMYDANIFSKGKKVSDLNIPNVAYFYFILLIYVNDFTHDHLKSQSRINKKDVIDKEKKAFSNILNWIRKKNIGFNMVNPKYKNDNPTKFNSLYIAFSYIMMLVDTFVNNEVTFFSYSSSSVSMQETEKFCLFKYFIDNLQYNASSDMNNKYKLKVNLLLTLLRSSFKHYQSIHEELTTIKQMTYHSLCKQFRSKCPLFLKTFDAELMETEAYTLLNFYAHKNNYTRKFRFTNEQLRNVKPFLCSNAYTSWKSFSSTHGLTKSNGIIRSDYELNNLATLTDSQLEYTSPALLNYYTYNKTSKEINTNKQANPSDIHKNNKIINNSFYDTLCVKTMNIPKSFDFDDVSGNITASSGNDCSFNLKIKNENIVHLYESTKKNKNNVQVNLIKELKYFDIDIMSNVKLNNYLLTNFTNRMKFKPNSKHLYNLSYTREYLVDDMIRITSINNSKLKTLLSHTFMKTCGDLYQILTLMNMVDSGIGSINSGMKIDTVENALLFGNHDITASIIFIYLLIFLKSDSYSNRACMLDHNEDNVCYTKQKSPTQDVDSILNKLEQMETKPIVEKEINIQKQVIEIKDTCLRLKLDLDKTNPNSIAALSLLALPFAGVRRQGKKRKKTRKPKRKKLGKKRTRQLSISSRNNVNLAGVKRKKTKGGGKKRVFDDTSQTITPDNIDTNNRRKTRKKMVQRKRMTQTELFPSFDKNDIKLQQTNLLYRIHSFYEVINYLKESIVSCESVFINMDERASTIYTTTVSYLEDSSFDAKRIPVYTDNELDTTILVGEYNNIMSNREELLEKINLISLLLKVYENSICENSCYDK